MAKEEAKAIINTLVERFTEHKNEYHLPDYNEQKARQDFINPFWKALGWDIDNEKGDSEAYREVIYEDKVVVRGKAKAPDYGFRLSGSGKKRLFYVEAKKPSVAIKTNKESAYQLRRYGSSAQAHVSILTNFEDFIVYDCSKVPNLNDSATVARLKHIGFESYIKEFDFIYDTFSHEAVTKGRFDKFVQGSANKKGTDTLDKRFVQSLDQWRKYLATSVALNNKKINDEELNYAVQQTIDRLIFLRFCEDRSVEPYGQLQQAASKGNAYNNLLDLFKQADDKYNSGLFDFEKDVITPTLKIDNKVIKTVIDELYYPKCNFEFSVMPVEILGNAYEQFLGKVIRILPSRGVKIEEKPEVRKAGGVFYTPQYIVDYIVKNTVGKLIDGKTPKEIEKIKIVDPACGSGSFLLGAFEYLLNYHVNWYHQNLSPSARGKKGEANPFTPQGTLTTHEKKRILTNNIYGVDLDANAVEVSKLSLLLKCMEGETEASIKQQITMFHERVLPNLDDNIKDGNSLIDTDIYDTEIDLGFEKKIKPFSWKKQFPQVFSPSARLTKGEGNSPAGDKGDVGGFDCVIGNPPYINTKRGFAEVANINIYFKEKYKTATGQFDAYSLFIEKAINLLKDKGVWGYIIPKPVLTNENMFVLRKTILNTGSIINIADFGTPFQDANVEAVVICQSKIELKENKISIQIKGYDKEPISQKIFLETPNNSFTLNASSKIENLLKKIEKNKIQFKSITSVFMRGIEAGKKDESIFNSKKNKNCKKLLRGLDVSRYSINYSGLYVSIDESNPSKFKSESVYNDKKIIIRRVGSDLQATIDNNSFWNLNTIYNVQLVNNSYEFITGAFNSKLISFWFKNRFVFEDKLFPYARVSQLETIPFPKISSVNKKTHDEIIKHVDLLLKLNEEIKEEKLPTKTEQLKQRIAHSEEKINQLVYELYELTEEEIAIVEGGTNE